MADIDLNYWQNRYETQKTQWDIGYASPALTAYFDQITDKNLQILIPGAGNGYEVAHLWEKGFQNVYLLDWATAPLLNFKAQHPDFPEKQLLLADFFTLSKSFDLIVEQTFFCAIPRNLRPQYAKKASELLSPKGKLIGLFFDDATLNSQEPPFGGTKDEYLTYFEPYFHINIFSPAYNSIKPRSGREFFVNLQRK